MARFVFLAVVITDMYVGECRSMDGEDTERVRQILAFMLVGAQIVHNLHSCLVMKVGSIAKVMSNIGKIFEVHQVVPDVIAVAPQKFAKVSYPSGAKVAEGNELTPTQVKDIPTVEWDSEAGSLYTLCMTDPDAPSRTEPKFREWHHWLVGNIPGNTISSGDTLSEYVGSGPPKDTGLHRYVFLIYKQPDKIQFKEEKLTNKSGAGRGNFSIAKFAEKYKLGNPVAGNLYQAAYDDYVPILYKQLGA